MNPSEIKTMVRCLVGQGSEQEKRAVFGLLGRAALGAGKRMVSSPGKLMKVTKGSMKGKMVRGPRQFSSTRAMYTGLAVAPGVGAGISAARSHPRAYRMNPGQRT